MAMPQPTRAPEALRILALGSAGLTALGMFLLAYDVLSQEQRGSWWIPLVAGSLGLVAAAVWSATRDAARDPATPIETPPNERARPYVIGGVIALLVLQAIVPLRYYVGDDAYDERFSWRMFSAIRMHSCQLTARETVGGAERVVPLMETIHVAWVTTLQRNREAVIERYLGWRCQQEGVQSARLDNVCRTPSGTQLPTIEREITCATGDIRREGGLAE